jgi:putative hydrolase of the HAD superfamily
MSGQVRVVWSDFGGVLTPPIEESLAAFCVTHQVDQRALLTAMAAVGARYGAADPLEPLDTPLVSEAEWLAQVSAELGGALRLTSLGPAWFDGRETNLAWVDELRAVRRQGLGVSMISNMVPAWDTYWRRMVDAEELFDHVVLSFEAGHRKPDKELFALAAQRAGVQPQECVLVDDLARNCEGALAAGWHAIHFTDTTSAAGGLRRLLAQ